MDELRTMFISSIDSILGLFVPPEQPNCRVTNTTPMDALRTPGIASLIAGELEPLDDGLKGLFLLTNDARYREELMPLMMPLKKKHELTLTITDLLMDIGLAYDQTTPLLKNVGAGWIIKDHSDISELREHIIKHIECTKKLYAFLSDHIDDIPNTLPQVIYNCHCHLVYSLEDVYYDLHQGDAYDEAIIRFIAFIDNYHNNVYPLYDINDLLYERWVCTIESPRR